MMVKWQPQVVFMKSPLFQITPSVDSEMLDNGDTNGAVNGVAKRLLNDSMNGTLYGSLRKNYNFAVTAISW